MNQKERVLHHLHQGNKITCLDAFSMLGITQIAARIFELKRDGHPISKRNVKIVNQFGESCYVSQYFLQGDS